MNVNTATKLDEAIRRMQALKVYPETIRQFKEDGKLSISEPPFGAFYWVEGADLDEVRRFENSNNALVYVVIRTVTSLGRMDSYLYVSDYSEEWEQDRNDIKENQVLAYVRNLDYPDCSEFGSIGIKPSIAGGLIRVW